MSPTPTKAAKQSVLTTLGLWPARVLWFLAPFVMLSAFDEALASSASAVSSLAEIGVWAAWFVGLVSLLAPSTTSLTIVRIIAPALPVLLLIAGVSGDFTGWVTAGLVYGFLLTLVVLLPTTGDPMINGSAYGPERRMALRPPASTLLGPIQVAWVLIVAGIVAGPLLLAANHTISGLIITVIGVAIAARMAAALHQLSRRWVVFVPAGFVVHDFWTMAESMLVQRRLRPMLGPAPADVEGAVDLTAGAMGLALAVEFSEAVPFALKRGRTIVTESSDFAIFSPTLPGRVLDEARARGISIG